MHPHPAQKTANELYLMAFEHAQAAVEILGETDTDPGTTESEMVLGVQIAQVNATLSQAYATMAMYRTPSR